MMNISNLAREDREWAWSHDGESYRTNRNGEGVWQLETEGYDVIGKRDGEEVCIPHKSWRQIMGTCDFWLRDMSMAGARKKLNRVFGGER